MRALQVTGMAMSMVLTCADTAHAQPAVSAAQKQAKGTDAQAGRDFILKVHVAKPVQATPSKFPASVQSPIPAPSLLKAVNDIRKYLKLEPVPVAPPTKVVLTPQLPIVGKNYVTTYTALGGGWGGIQPHLGALCIAGGWLEVSFETILGKTYLLDIQLESVGGMPFPVEGAINGEIPMQVFSTTGFIKGHLLGAFMATQGQSTLKMRVEVGRFTSFSRFELRQVD